MSIDLLSRFTDPDNIHSIPGEFRRFLAPAEICLYEWQEYYLDLPEADQIIVGQYDKVSQIPGTHIYRLRFENQLGLSKIQAFRNSKPLCPPLHVEVISGKFPSVEQHLLFLQSLLSDLFERAANLPFTISSPTTQNTVEAFRPPTPLFILYFLHQFGKILQDSTEVVLSAPHRLLCKREEKLPVFEACEVDGDVIIDMLTDTREWIPASEFQLTETLGGFAPERIWQWLPEETLDTPENRFIRHFLRQVLSAADALPSRPWWTNVAEEHRRSVLETANYVRRALLHPMFTDMGELFRLPFESRVLTRREGYRELMDLWFRFQQARRPLFEQLQQAIDLHNVAFLYEMWVFFKLAEEIGKVFGEKPVLHLSISEESGLKDRSEARIGSWGKLVYNRMFAKNDGQYRSYSLGLKPDYVWVEKEKQPQVVFDAKFRFNLEQGDLSQLEQPDNFEAHCPRITAVHEDIHKMHTYRDALGVRCAVVCYPGNQAVAYDEQQGGRVNVDLTKIIVGNFTGVGAIPYTP